MFRTLTTALATGILAGAALAEPALYDTPQSALEALITSVEAGDRQALLVVFGEEAEDLILSDDADEDQSDRAALLDLYREGYRFQPDGDAVTLILGEDSWPFPIPLARSEDGWRFDFKAGREEIEDREIGLNELEVIDLLEAYVDLQAAFRLVDHDGDGVMEFASEIISDPVKKNGLFWPDGPGFVGAVLARAELSGWSDGEDDYEPEPFLGYYFTILHGQGANAPGMPMSYFAGENLVAGHAMIAVPAEYGTTGIHSFLVGENGVVYEADLGEETLDVAAEITEYDPGPEWEAVDLSLQ